MFGTKGKRPGRSSVLLSGKWMLLKDSFENNNDPLLRQSASN